MNENQIIEFTNEQFGKIRTVLINGEPWFVGRDVAIALGYSQPAKAVREKVEDDDKGVSKMDTPGGLQDITVINESGLYSLILSSKLPTAKMFKRWVTSEVLPTIRKTGSYATPEAIYKTLTEPKNLIIVLETLAEEQAKNKKLTAENAVLSVKAKYYDAILASFEALPITQIAKDYGTEFLASCNYLGSHFSKLRVILLCHALSLLPVKIEWGRNNRIVKIRVAKQERRIILCKVVTSSSLTFNALCFDPTRSFAQPTRCTVFYNKYRFTVCILL